MKRTLTLFTLTLFSCHNSSATPNNTNWKAALAKAKEIAYAYTPITLTCNKNPNSIIPDVQATLHVSPKTVQGYFGAITGLAAAALCNHYVKPIVEEKILSNQDPVLRKLLSAVIVSPAPIAIGYFAQKPLGPAFFWGCGFGSVLNFIVNLCSVS